MDPVELIKRDLGADGWAAACRSRREPIQELDEQCPFVRYKLFVVSGQMRQFDFPTLPHGSYGYYAANGFTATRLTRESKEIESILADEWSDLPAADPVLLASVVLKFFDGGIKASHHVLKDVGSLRDFGESKYSSKNYELNERQLAKVLAKIGETNSVLSRDHLAIRAVTLCGWMHRKQNLGVESFTIDQKGNVSFARRCVLSRRIFARVPGIRY